MLISEPIFIKKTEKRGYIATGSLEGYGRIKRYGQSEAEAKERFFEACNVAEHASVTGGGHIRTAA